MDGRTGRRRIGRLAAVVMVLASAGCWPAAGQGPDRTAHNPFETVLTPDTVGTLAPVWTATTDAARYGGVVGPPVVSSTGVHVTDTAAVYTFDKATGARRWDYPEFDTIAGVFTDPIVDGDRVLASYGAAGGFTGVWQASATWLDARTGAEQPGAVRLKVTARRGTRLAGFSANGGSPAGFLIFALEVIDTADPSASWSRPVRVSTVDFTIHPPATLGDERLYYAGAATESFEDPPVEFVGVRAYPVTPPGVCRPPGPPDIDLACPLWSTPTPGRPVTSPVLAPDESALYVGTGDGTLLALDATDGHVLWTAALGAAPSADPALADGSLYVPLADGDLAVLPAGGCGAATCPTTWRAPVGGAGEQPAVAGGVVFVGTDGGDLVALRAAGCGTPTCLPIWQHDFGAPVTGAPAVTGGRVYVGVAPDRVVALAPT